MNKVKNLGRIIVAIAVLAISIFAATVAVDLSATIAIVAVGVVNAVMEYFNIKENISK